eukprot:scaffold286796_cov32-Tisochrysis_lutea.AAC.5
MLHGLIVKERPANQPKVLELIGPVPTHVGPELIHLQPKLLADAHPGMKKRTMFVTEGRSTPPTRRCHGK